MDFEYKTVYVSPSTVKSCLAKEFYPAFFLFCIHYPHVLFLTITFLIILSVLLSPYNDPYEDESQKLRLFSTCYAGSGFSTSFSHTYFLFLLHRKSDLYSCLPLRWNRSPLTHRPWPFGMSQRRRMPHSKGYYRYQGQIIPDDIFTFYTKNSLERKTTAGKKKTNAPKSRWTHSAKHPFKFRNLFQPSSAVIRAETAPEERLFFANHMRCNPAIPKGIAIDKAKTMNIAEYGEGYPVECISQKRNYSAELEKPYFFRQHFRHNPRQKTYRYYRHEWHLKTCYTHGVHNDDYGDGSQRSAIHGSVATPITIMNTGIARARHHMVRQPYASRNPNSDRCALWFSSRGKSSEKPYRMPMWSPSTARTWAVPLFWNSS